MKKKNAIFDDIHNPPFKHQASWAWASINIVESCLTHASFTPLAYSLLIFANSLCIELPVALNLQDAFTGKMKIGTS